MHDFLIWSYIILTVAGFCYAVGCIRGFFRLGMHRKNNINPLHAAALGLFVPAILSDQGKVYRLNLIDSIRMGLLCTLGLVTVVIVGILTKA